MFFMKKVQLIENNRSSVSPRTVQRVAIPKKAPTSLSPNVFCYCNMFKLSSKISLDFRDARLMYNQQIYINKQKIVPLAVL